MSDQFSINLIFWITIAGMVGVFVIGLVLFSQW